jgi:hypothetical protein
MLRDKEIMLRDKEIRERDKRVDLIKAKYCF